MRRVLLFAILLQLPLSVLSGSSSVSSSGKSQIESVIEEVVVPAAETITAFPDKVECEKALPQKFQNFPSGGKLQIKDGKELEIKSGKELEIVRDPITEVTVAEMDERTDSWLKSVFGRPTGKEDIQDTLLRASVLSFTSSGKSEIEEVAETIIAFTDKANLEIAFLQKFRNFRCDGKLQKKGGKEPEIARNLIKELTAADMDERMDYWLKSLFVVRRPTEKEEICQAVDEARRNFRSGKSSSSNPQTMLKPLMHSFESYERLSDLSYKEICDTLRDAEKRVYDENTKLKEELAKYDDIKQMEEALEILLSEGEAGDSGRYHRLLKNAKNKVQAQLLVAAHHEFHHSIDERHYKALVHHQLPTGFAERYDLVDILSDATSILRELLSRPKYENADNDRTMIKLLMREYPDPENEARRKARIEEAVLNSRKTVTLANAVRFRKLYALSKLLEEYGDFGKYAYQYLVVLAVELKYLDALKVLLRFSKNDKDAGAALRVLVEKRVKVESIATLRESEQSLKATLEANTEMINFLVEDRRITVKKMKEIRAKVITRDAPTTGRMWRDLMEFKKKRESEDRKRRVKEKPKGWRIWRKSKSSVDRWGSCSESICVESSIRSLPSTPGTKV